MTFSGDPELDSACSTPYTSAPSSPSRSASTGGGGGFFFSAPASPVHYILSSYSSSTATTFPNDGASTSTSASTSTDDFQFEFSTRSMIPADEIFCNGQIRPMRLPSHLEADEEEEEEEEIGNSTSAPARGRDLRIRNRSFCRRTRSASPIRNPTPFEWHDDEENETAKVEETEEPKEPKTEEEMTLPVTASASATSRRSSRKWVFLKDLLTLNRSKSEGSGKEKVWKSTIATFSPSKESKHISSFFSRDKTKQQPKPVNTADLPAARKPPRNGVIGGRRRRTQEPSAHERHYTAKRAQAEEMRRKTFLPYRQGLLGCLGFTSKGYGAMNGFARTLNSVASR